jgi:NTP pyrophosphatase (non-canonical NTP hydrolase)
MTDLVDDEHFVASTELLELCCEAIDTFGPMVQAGKCVEELGEMCQELFKKMQYQHDPVNMEGEIADCIILLMQMLIALDTTTFNETLIAKMGKLRRAIQQYKLDKQKSH